jgi:prephenate dehydratase
VLRSSDPPEVIAFHGEPGAFSEAAALAWLGEKRATLPCPSPAEVFQALEAGRAGRGIVPIEHSLTGSEHRTYDLLLKHRLHIVGETYLPIAHCLVAHPGVKLAQIRRIYSHPQALEQCRTFLSQLNGVRSIPESNTSGAVAQIKKRGRMDAAAIASERAASLYGMKVLARSIEDPPANITRFLLLGPEPLAPFPSKKRAETSLVFTVRDLSRQFFSCLSVFALRELPLTKIETRPVRGRLTQFLFYLDIAAPLADPNVEAALAQLRELAPWVRVLGCYPEAKRA